MFQSLLLFLFPEFLFLLYQCHSLTLIWLICYSFTFPSGWKFLETRGCFAFFLIVVVKIGPRITETLSWTLKYKLSINWYISFLSWWVTYLCLTKELFIEHLLCSRHCASSLSKYRQLTCGLCEEFPSSGSLVALIQKAIWCVP